MNHAIRTRSALRAVALAALCAAPAFATTARAPVTTYVDSPKTWIYYVVIAVLAAATVGVSIMSSKRGHQD